MSMRRTEEAWPCLRFPRDATHDTGEAQRNELRERAEMILGDCTWFLTWEQDAGGNWWALTFKDEAKKVIILAAFG